MKAEALFDEDPEKAEALLTSFAEAMGIEALRKAKELEGRVKHVLLFGRDRGMLKEAMDKAGYTDYSEQADLEECVMKGREMAEPGDKILLSPACASWDMYPNFEVRGKHFKDIVSKIRTR